MVDTVIDLIFFLIGKRIVWSVWFKSGELRLDCFPKHFKE